MSIGERIRHARKLRALSLRELADQVGVSHNAISKYEKGEDVPSSGVIIRLADALDVTPDYFFRDSSVKLQEPSFRCKGKLAAREEKKLLAKIGDWLERYREVEFIFEADGNRSFRFPRGFPMEVKTPEEVEVAAEKLRHTWDVGSDAIDDLISVLEDRALRVFEVEEPKPFDGLIVPVEGGDYVIAVNSSFSGDHKRFSLAHELGHLLLRPARNLKPERAFHRFAAAFLVPRSVAFSRLGKQRRWLDINELHLLKHEYGLSMQAWIRRANELNIISGDVQGKLLTVFKVNGWAETEPGTEYPPERPRRMERLVYRALAERLISESGAFELLGGPINRDFAPSNSGPAHNAN